MSFVKWAGVVVVLLMSAIGRGQVCKSVLPPAIRSNIVNNGWKIVDVEDLVPDDQELWRNAHKGLCPGVAIGNFQPDIESQFAIALIQRNREGKLNEKLIMVKSSGERIAKSIVVPTSQVASPFVIWKLRAGIYADVTGKKRRIELDSFVYEKIEAFATQFFYENGHFEHFVTSE